MLTELAGIEAENFTSARNTLSDGGDFLNRVQQHLHRKTTEYATWMDYREVMHFTGRLEAQIPTPIGSASGDQQAVFWYSVHSSMENLCTNQLRNQEKMIIKMFTHFFWEISPKTRQRLGKRSRNWACASTSDFRRNRSFLEGFQCLDLPKRAGTNVKMVSQLDLGGDCTQPNQFELKSMLEFKEAHIGICSWSSGDREASLDRFPADFPSHTVTVVEDEHSRWNDDGRQSIWCPALKTIDALKTTSIEDDSLCDWRHDDDITCKSRLAKLSR